MTYPKEEESMENILSSIRNLIYPESEPANSADIIDLVEPIQEESTRPLPGKEEAASALASFQEALQNAIAPSSRPPSVSLSGSTSSPLPEKSTSASVTLEAFLKELITPHLKGQLQSVAAEVLSKEARAALPGLLEKWIEKNLSRVVVECVERKLTEMQKEPRSF